MRRFGLLLLGLSLSAVAYGDDRPAQPTSAESSDRRDLALEVKKIFTVKCVQCHGSHLRNPKGKFGYILDLARVAGNPKIVVPSHPDKSKLWQLVQDDEMPPEDAKAGPLAREQKEVIRAWIESGAPSTPPDQAPAVSSPGSLHPEGSSADAAGLPFGKRLLSWLGKFHVMVVHFPIGLLVAAAAGELWFAWRRVSAPAPAVRFCVLLGAAGALAAAALGWLHAANGYGASSPGVLAFHRWAGTALALWAVAVVVCSELDARRGERGWSFRLLLLCGVLLVAVTGHLGGTLVHGEEFFDW
jgi:uncharacterized membrane protein